MAKISATVVESESGLVIEAARQSSCAHCNKQSSCASQWQIDDNAFTIPTPNSSVFKPGDAVTFECSEKTLLHYFALLFLPTLFFLLIANTAVEFFVSSDAAWFSIAFQFIFPVLAGAWLSKKLLAQAQDKLLAAQSIQLKVE